MTYEEATGIYRRGKRDIIAAPILALVVLLGALLVGEGLPILLMDAGVPEAVARLYFMVPMVMFGWFGAFAWRQMRYASEVLSNQDRGP